MLDFHREVEVSLPTLKLAAPEKGDEVRAHTHTHTHTPPLQVKVLSGADKDSVGSLYHTIPAAYLSISTFLYTRHVLHVFNLSWTACMIRNEQAYIIIIHYCMS